MERSSAFRAVMHSLESRAERQFSDQLDMRALAALEGDEREEVRKILVERVERGDDPRVPWALAQLDLDAVWRALDKPAIAVSAAAALRDVAQDRLKPTLIAGLDGPEAAAAAYELRYYSGRDVDAALSDAIERRGDVAAVATQSLFFKHSLNAWKPPVHLRGMALLEARASSEFDSLRRPVLSSLRALLAGLAQSRRPYQLGYLPVDPERSETLQRFLASMDAPGDYDAASLAQLDGEERAWAEYMLSVQELLQSSDARAARVLAEVKWPATVDPLRAALGRTRGVAPVEAARALLAIGQAREEAIALLRRVAADSSTETRETALRVLREFSVI